MSEFAESILNDNMSQPQKMSLSRELTSPYLEEWQPSLASPILPSAADLDAAQKEKEAAEAVAPPAPEPKIANPHGQIWDAEVYATNPDGTPAVDSVGHYIKKALHYAPVASGWPGQS